MGKVSRAGGPVRVCGRLRVGLCLRYRVMCEAIHDLCNATTTALKVLQLFAVSCEDTERHVFVDVWTSAGDVLHVICTFSEASTFRKVLNRRDFTRDAEKKGRLLREAVSTLSVDLHTLVQKRVKALESRVAANESKLAEQDGKLAEQDGKLAEQGQKIKQIQKVLFDKEKWKRTRTQRRRSVQFETRKFWVGRRAPWGIVPGC